LVGYLPNVCEIFETVICKFVLAENVIFEQTTS